MNRKLRKKLLKRGSDMIDAREGWDDPDDDGSWRNDADRRKRRRERRMARERGLGVAFEPNVPDDD